MRFEQRCVVHNFVLFGSNFELSTTYFLILLEFFCRFRLRLGDIFYSPSVF